MTNEHTRADVPGALLGACGCAVVALGFVLEPETWPVFARYVNSQAGPFPGSDAQMREACDAAMGFLAAIAERL